MVAMALAVVHPELQAAEGDGLQFSGSARVRHESLHNQYRPGLARDDDMLALRISLLAEWKQGSWRVVGELSDSRAYDTGPRGVLSANEVNALEPVQAFVQRRFAGALGKGTSIDVQAGRFQFNLGSRRLIASDDFRNTPQGYTGLKTELRLADRSQWTLFYVLPQQRRPDDRASLQDNEPHLDREGLDQRLFGAQWSRPAMLPGAALAEATYVRFEERDRGARATRDRRLHSLGLRAIREPRARQFDYEVETVWQTGSISATAAASADARDVRAWFLHADAGYTFDGAAKLRLSAEYDYASGDGPNARYQRFDTLFGMRRADLAPSGIYGLLGRTNLESLGLRLEAAPSPRLDMMATWHLAWSPARRDAFSTSGVRDPGGAAGDFAGAQLDSRIRYWIVPRKLRAEFNGIWFDRGRQLRRAPNATAAGDPLYVATSLTFSF